jgi:hypothetical protein
MVDHREVPETPNPILSLFLEGFKRPAGLNRDSRSAAFEGGIRGPKFEHQVYSGTLSPIF